MFEPLAKLCRKAVTEIRSSCSMTYAMQARAGSASEMFCIVFHEGRLLAEVWLQLAWEGSGSHTSDGGFWSLSLSASQSSAPAVARQDCTLSAA